MIDEDTGWWPHVQWALREGARDNASYGMGRIMWILLDLFHKKIDLQENNVSRDRPLIVRLTWASVGLACKDRLDCCSAGRETRGSGKRFDIVCGERPRLLCRTLLLAKALQANGNST